MKILLKILFCLFALGITKSTVFAEQNYIYLGDVIPNVRLYLKTPTIEKYKNMYEIINRDTNELVYCIEPGIMLKNGYFEAYQGVELIPDDLEITNDDWNNLLTIAYFGYGYQDRLDIKWYVATQFMIWEYLLEDSGEVYFVDNNNQKIDLFEEEINIIKKDIENYFVFPSFLENNSFDNIKCNDTITLIDKNQVLDDCLIYISNGAYKINNNEITFNFSTPGEQILNFTKKIDISATPKIFYNSASQTVINRGIIKTPYKTLNVKVEFPKFTLIKKDADHPNLSIEGAVYGIYYEDGSLYQKAETNKEGTIYLEQIDLGKYYVQEIKAPYGYELNDEKIYFEVKQDDVVIEVSDSLLKKEIVIEKYLEDLGGNLELEKNAKFQVYNQNNELITEFQTNEYGKYQLVLPYGDYTLKQVASTEGYLLANDINLTVNEETASNLIIKNSQIVGSLVILKLDLDSKEKILDEASFKIYDVGRHKYFQINGDEIFKTKDGKIVIDEIPYGNYQLIEVSSPANYLPSKEEITFSIKDSEEISLEVYNKLQKGSLEIEKIDDKTLKPLQGVLFGLYDQNKNLIDEYITDENGKIYISNLLEGLYYIKEMATLDDYYLLDGFKEVNIKNNVLTSFKVTNRMKIEVPKTGVNELFYTILFSSFCLLVGIILCNYDKNN